MPTTKMYSFRGANSIRTWALVGSQRMWLPDWPTANQYGTFQADVNIIDPSSPLLTLPILGPTPPSP